MHPLVTSEPPWPLCQSECLHLPLLQQRKIYFNKTLSDRTSTTITSIDALCSVAWAMRLCDIIVDQCAKSTEHRGRFSASTLCGTLWTRGGAKRDSYSMFVLYGRNMMNEDPRQHTMDPSTTQRQWRNRSSLSSPRIKYSNIFLIIYIDHIYVPMNNIILSHVCVL